MRVILGHLLVLLITITFAHYAFAEGTEQSFRCAAGAAQGELHINNATCPTSLSTTNFFSFLICNIQKLSTNVMGSLYCGTIDALKPSILAAVTLAVTLFGIAFMTGITDLSRGGAIAFGIKLAFIMGFALNSDLLIGVAYRFLMGVMQDGATISLAAISSDAKDMDGLYTLLDNAAAKAFSLVTDMLNGTLAKEAVATENRCKNAIFAVLVTMLVAAPMVGYLGLALLARIILAFFSAIFGYVYALIGITFLMVLAPIFICFYLFKQTQQFFDKWVSYLASFSLQVVLLFAFMSFVLSIDISGHTQSITNIIMFNAQAAQTQSYRLPWQYCTLCDFETYKKGTDEKMNYDAKEFATKGEFRCVDHKGETGADAQGRKPITLSFAIAPSSGKASNKDVAALGSLLKIGAGSLLSLIILAWMVENLLGLIPSLAQQIAGKLGAAAAPQLGGGFSAYGQVAPIPGARLLNDFQSGFTSGYSSKLKENSLSATYEGMRQGLSLAVTGKQLDANGKPIENANTTARPGLGNHFLNWLSDPAKLD